MIRKELMKYAEANFFCNVELFLALGEDRKFTPLEVHHLKQKYPTVEEWFVSLPEPGKKRVIHYLEWQLRRSTKTHPNI